MIKSNIQNKDGNQLEITKRGDAQVVVQSYPPFDGVQPLRIHRAYLTDDGLPFDGTNQDMTVNGSSTNVEYYIQADQDLDVYISTLSFVLADAGAANNEFGALSALSNGCELKYSDEFGDVIIHEGFKTNFELVRLCSGKPAFGATTNTFRANNVSGSSEAYIPVLNIVETFGMSRGIMLRAGSKQRITITIKDNIAAVDQFDCIAYGFTVRDI